MAPERRSPAPAGGAGNGADEHGQALTQEHSTPPTRRDLDQLASDSYPAPDPPDPEAEREAILQRIAGDGGQRAAFALLALHAESPALADPILEHFARYTDEIDNLLLSLGDAAVREGT